MGEVLEAYFGLEPKLAISIAARGLAAINHGRNRDSVDVLMHALPAHADAVIEAMGNVMLSEEHARTFSFNRYRALITAIPIKALQDWLSRAGNRGALAIAGHLPTPYLDEASSPVIPEITEWFLASYGDNDEIFTEYCQTSVQERAHEEMHSGLKSRIALANTAQSLRNHRSQLIRDWAAYVVKDLESHSDLMDRLDAESAEWRFRPPNR
jgi:hypothetical protein